MLKPICTGKNPEEHRLQQVFIRSHLTTDQALDVEIRMHGGIDQYLIKKRSDVIAAAHVLSTKVTEKLQVYLNDLDTTYLECDKNTAMLITTLAEDENFSHFSCIHLLEKELVPLLISLLHFLEVSNNNNLKRQLLKFLDNIPLIP